LRAGERATGRASVGPRLVGPVLGTACVAGKHPRIGSPSAGLHPATQGVVVRYGDRLCRERSSGEVTDWWMCRLLSSESEALIVPCQSVEGYMQFCM
jgi:hypothetical protein